MSLMLIALWIAGHTFQWYWLAGAVVFDLLWMAVKLNFLAVLVRRSIEDTLQAIIESQLPPAPPPEA